MKELGLFGILSYLTQSQIKRITLDETNLILDRVNTYLNEIDESVDTISKIELTNIIQAIADNILSYDF